MRLKISTKKLVIILALLAALIAAVYFVYVFFFRTSTQTAPNEQEIINNAKKTQILFPLSQGPVLSPTINSSGNKVRYYSKNNGNIYEVNFDGTGLSRVSAANLAGLLNIIWSPDKEKVIGLFQKRRPNPKVSS